MHDRELLSDHERLGGDAVPCGQVLPGTWSVQRCAVPRWLLLPVAVDDQSCVVHDLQLLSDGWLVACVAVSCGQLLSSDQPDQPCAVPGRQLLP